MSSKKDKVKLTKMPSGKYQHFSLEHGLRNILSAMKSAKGKIPNVLKLIVNIDGIRLSKSSSSEFWPILVKVKGTLL